MKFGQLIEYNMRNIFLEKSYGEKIIQTLFKKANTERISGSVVSSSIQLVFIV